ncbi:MAG: lauroyl acyltransferase [Sphingobacteriales bacterium]|nr:MAG: lauroyl acyltransferase [Sphingobacteriales bacterium]
MTQLYRFLLFSFSRLRFPVIYAFSDLLYFVFFYVLKYRKKVVEENLKNAFPEKSDNERYFLMKQFYKHLSDITLETLKALTISKTELQKRCKIADSEGARKYFSDTNGAIVFTAHTGNWEWGGLIFGLETKNRPVQVVYLKIKNLEFNELMKDLRSRFGNQTVHMEKVFRESLKNRQLVSCFLADQTPQRHQIGYWADFLNQKTPFFNGAEKMAQKLKQNVYFVNIRKVKRGFYELDIDVITDNPAETAPNQIISTYTKMLEQAIRNQPYNWLWSHRRWKHKFSEQ